MTLPKSLPKPKKLNWPLLVRRVNGESMLPALPEGRLVVIYVWPRSLRTSDIVMIEHQGIEKIKRIQAIKDGKIYILGDNPASSTDSRQFGWVPINHVRGRVVGKRLNRASSKQL